MQPTSAYSVPWLPLPASANIPPLRNNDVDSEDMLHAQTTSTSNTDLRGIEEEESVYSREGTLGYIKLHHPIPVRPSYGALLHGPFTYDKYSKKLVQAASDYSHAGIDDRPNILFYENTRYNLRSRADRPLRQPHLTRITAAPLRSSKTHNLPHISPRVVQADSHNGSYFKKYETPEATTAAAMVQKDLSRTVDLGPALHSPRARYELRGSTLMEPSLLPQPIPEDQLHYHATTNQVAVAAQQPSPFALGPRRQMLETKCAAMPTRPIEGGASMTMTHNHGLDDLNPPRLDSDLTDEHCQAPNWGWAPEQDATVGRMQVAIRDDAVANSSADFRTRSMSDENAYQPLRDDVSGHRTIGKPIALLNPASLRYRPDTDSALQSPVSLRPEAPITRFKQPEGRSRLAIPNPEKQVTGDDDTTTTITPARRLRSLQSATATASLQTPTTMRRHTAGESGIHGTPGGMTLPESRTTQLQQLQVD